MSESNKKEIKQQESQESVLDRVKYTLIRLFTGNNSEQNQRINTDTETNIETNIEIDLSNISQYSTVLEVNKMTSFIESTPNIAPTSLHNFVYRISVIIDNFNGTSPDKERISAFLRSLKAAVEHNCFDPNYIIQTDNRESSYSQLSSIIHLIDLGSGFPLVKKSTRNIAKLIIKNKKFDPNLVYNFRGEKHDILSFAFKECRLSLCKLLTERGADFSGLDRETQVKRQKELEAYYKKYEMQKAFLEANETDIETEEFYFAGLIGSYANSAGHRTIKDIENMQRIGNGTFEEIERRLKNTDNGDTPFLGESESLRALLIEDHKTVTEELEFIDPKMSHWKLAIALCKGILADQMYHEFDEHCSFTINNKQFKVIRSYTHNGGFTDSGNNMCRFGHGIPGLTDYTIGRLKESANKKDDNRIEEKFKFNILHVSMIARDGYYEGRGAVVKVGDKITTSYRKDPKDIARFFNFNFRNTA
jgi:hypothetical protein